jgi:hypothetical protein
LFAHSIHFPIKSNFFEKDAFRQPNKTNMVTRLDESPLFGRPFLAMLFENVKIGPHF